MVTKLLIFILLVGSAIAKQKNRIKSSFQRSAVESIPTSAVSFFQNYGSSNSVDGKALGGTYFESYLYPSRSAVEKIPSVEERGQEHFPIRDAVEKIPPINEYLENFRSHTLQKQTTPEESSYRVVCYLPSWTYYRGGETKYTPDYVDPNLCTHIVYAHASLSAENFTIIPSHPVTDIDSGFYRKITAPEITSVSKVLISIGRWTDSGGDEYARLVRNGNNRHRFVNSVIAFFKRYNFSGLHFDWKYPVCWQSHCSNDHSADKGNFVKLIQELRHEFDKHNPRYELAVGVSGNKEIINEVYDILNLSENVDFLSVSNWENHIGHPSPLYSDPNNNLPDYSTHTTMTSLVMRGADPKKLVMGVPLFGQSFTLVDAAHHEIGNETLEPGEPAEFIQQPGILSYPEICIRTSKQGWQTGRNPETGTDSYAFKGNQWVRYDDKHCLRRKMNYLKKSGYGGVMTWTLDLDDFNNECCTGVYPLLHEINVALGRHTRYPGVLDCTKPVVIPLENETTPGVTWTEVDEARTPDIRRRARDGSYDSTMRY